MPGCGNSGKSVWLVQMEEGVVKELMQDKALEVDQMTQFALVAHDAWVHVIVRRQRFDDKDIIELNNDQSWQDDVITPI